MDWVMPAAGGLLVGTFIVSLLHRDSLQQMARNMALAVVGSALGTLLLWFLSSTR